MPYTPEHEDPDFAKFMAGDDPKSLRALVERGDTPPRREAPTEGELETIPLASSATIPATLTICVNGFDRQESEFRCGTFKTILREIPEPLRRRIETLLRSFPADERVGIQLDAEVNAAWHDLAWYLHRIERYAARRVQRYPECTCIDCGQKFPASQSWCINPKCSGAEAYQRITGKAPTTFVMFRGQAPPTTTASKGGMRPPKKRRTG